MTSKTKSTKSTATAGPFDPLTELTKAMEAFTVPGVDVSALIGLRPDDINALIDANMAAYQTMQALAQRQTEMLTQAAQSMQTAARAAAGGEAIHDPVKCTEAAREAWQKAVADMTELAEMVRKSQVDVMNRLGERAAQAKREVEQMMKPQ